MSYTPLTVVDVDVDVVCEGTWNTKESCLIK